VELSIIIPAWNEEAKIARDIRDADAFLHAQGLTRTGEIIVADDGSTDETASRAQLAAESLTAPLVVLRCEHHGKGAAIRAGLARAQGDFVLLCDAGGCIPLVDALPGLDALRAQQAEVAIGSRFGPDGKIEKSPRWSRRLLSRLFRWFLPRWAGLVGRYSDTQCGCKLLTRQAAHLFATQCEMDGFLLDVEMLLRAEHAGWRVMEFPVHWRSDADSRLTVWRSSAGVLRELIQLRKIRKAHRERRGWR
jgi:dolichyl-phosphate beta-glucosyltransferase